MTTCKLRGVFAAFSELGVDAEPVVYSDESADAVREQLLTLDGVLVWVNPIEKGLDRSRLDSLLREVAAHGVFVSAHPDVILRLGTKEVLVDTRSLSCGTDTHVYRMGARAAAILGLRTAQLPVIWDLDFLYGAKTADGEDTYVLCEINVSSTFAFPEFAMPGVARAAVERIRERREAGSGRRRRAAPRSASTPDAPP